MSTVPFTYYIGWSELNLHYYGLSYKRGTNPKRLWTKYFTSSSYVKRLRKNYGEPDIIQVRKIFDCPKKARQWETKVLRRMNVINDLKWLNVSNNNETKQKYFSGFLAPNYGYVFSEIRKTNKKEQYKKFKWWNNGVEQKFQEFPPDETFVRGRLPFNNVGAQLGANVVKMKKWYTNGIDSIMMIPGTEPEGFIPGRTFKKKKKTTNKFKGAKWWTNGSHSILTHQQPDSSYYLGRVF